MSVRIARRATMQARVIPVTTGGLAMPQGPTILEDSAIAGGRQVTSGFAQAGDFYDSIGINYHAELQSNDVVDSATACDRLDELGIRHVRCGMWTPAQLQNQSVHMAAFMAQLVSRAIPAFILYGTIEEPAVNVGNASRAKFKIGTPTDSNPDDTFFRTLDGRTGTVQATNWPASSPYYPNERKYLPGTFNDWGWGTAGGLQGPNEPDARTIDSDSIRNEVHAAFKRAKNARPTEPILGGGEYIDSTTGRITPGPAYAPQLPVVASPPRQQAGDAFYIPYGDYTLTGEADVGSKHVYFDTHCGQPSYRGMWEKSTQSAISSGKGWPGFPAFRYRTQSYNGRLTPGGIYSSELPYFVTECGSVQAPSAAGSSVYYPQEVMAEYFCRYFIHNYLGGARRTYVMKLNDEPGTSFPAGICGTDWAPRASFYGLKNLLSLVGWTQGTTSQQITVTNNFTTSNNEHNQWASGGAAQYWDFDGLQQLVLQRDDGYLVILSRSRVLWDVVNQAHKSVDDPKTVTVTVPAGMFTSCSRAVPALNPVVTANGIDGWNYSWSGDSGGTNGTAYRPWTSGEVGGSLAFNGTTFSTAMAGLTQVFKLTP